MTKIKNIVVIGTSFSSAGGFEPDSAVRKILPKYDDMPIPQQMEDCAWPAYLQKMIPDIKVHNLARPGAGIEHLIRVGTEWIRDHDVKDTLFLLEGSGYGRMELWDVDVKKHVICNWEKNKSEEKYKLSIHSGEYWKDSPEYSARIESKKEVLREWMKAYLDPNVNVQNLSRQLFNFICMLNYKGIKFKLFGERFIERKVDNEPIVISNFLKLYEKDKIYCSIHNWIIESGYQIKLVTQGENQDFHATVRGNKVIAETYYDQLKSLL